MTDCCCECDCKPEVVEKVVVMEDAPVLVYMKDSSKPLALCRCGQTNNAPYCDGSHVSAGFKSPSLTIGE